MTPLRRMKTLFLTGFLFVGVLYQMSAWEARKAEPVEGQVGASNQHFTHTEDAVKNKNKDSSSLHFQHPAEHNQPPAKHHQPPPQQHQPLDQHLRPFETENTRKRQDLVTMNATERNSLFFRVDMKPVLAAATTGGPMNYLPNYRNPCWKSTPLSMSDCGLRCLPLVFLVGVTKSGTTDLYDKLTKHSAIAKPREKEPMWWNRGSLKTYPRLLKTFEGYVRMFDQAACEIERSPANSSNYHHKVTIDGTPAYLWDYDGWEKIPGNKGLSEPKYILPSVLKVLIPNAKIIAILRQPSERLYSNFRMKTPKASTRDFHRMATEAVSLYNKCLDKHSLRHCAYSHTVVRDEFTRGLFIKASMYYVFIKDWLDYFPRDQVHVIKAEDYFGNRTQTLMETFSFLDLDMPSDSYFQTTEYSKPKNTRSQYHRRSQDEMLPETKELLDSFFGPLNDQLAELLGDDKFRWTSDPA